MASACGIDVERINRIDLRPFGSGLAGVAGVMMSGFKTVFPDPMFQAMKKGGGGEG